MNYNIIHIILYLWSKKVTSIIFDKNRNIVYYINLMLILQIHSLYTYLPTLWKLFHLHYYTQKRHSYIIIVQTILVHWISEKRYRNSYL